MTDLDPRLGAAIRDRVAHEYPDLDQLVAVSVRAGTRPQRRRRAGIAIAAAAGVAAITIVGSQLGGGAGTVSREGDVGFATEPTAPVLQVAVAGAHVQAPSGADVYFTGPTRRWRELKASGEVSAGQEAEVTALIAAQGDATVTDATETWLRATYSSVGSIIRDDPQARGTAPLLQPFTVTAPGWTCSEPGDEKFDCTKGGDSVHVVWRDAASHADYAAGTPDKRADWVSEVHGDVFVTVDGPAAPTGLSPAASRRGPRAEPPARSVATPRRSARRARLDPRPRG